MYETISSLLLSILLLLLLCIPAFVGLLRWAGRKKTAPTGAKNLPAKCQSCGNSKGCAQSSGDGS